MASGYSSHILSLPITPAYPFPHTHKFPSQQCHSTKGRWTGHLVATFKNLGCKQKIDTGRSEKVGISMWTLVNKNFDRQIFPTSEPLLLQSKMMCTRVVDPGMSTMVDYGSNEIYTRGKNSSTINGFKKTEYTRMAKINTGTFCAKDSIVDSGHQRHLKAGYISSILSSQ